MGWSGPLQEERSWVYQTQQLQADSTWLLESAVERPGDVGRAQSSACTWLALRVCDPAPRHHQPAHDQPVVSPLRLGYRVHKKFIGHGMNLIILGAGRLTAQLHLSQSFPCFVQIPRSCGQVKWFLNPLDRAGALEK